jgi:hypothetical protein
VGRHIRAHAQELITFPRGRKTDWGKKRGFLKIYRPVDNIRQWRMVEGWNSDKWSNNSNHEKGTF